jgi:AcrR family transcriptional regulator
MSLSARPARSDVLKTAARIVAREGPESLTMERLARATGASRATLYRRVGGRNAVLDVLAATGAEVGDRSGTRTRILRAAREVFGRVGFEAAAVDEVAAAANVGVATVYRQFGDKEGLVAAFLDEAAPRRAAREARVSSSGDLHIDLARLAEHTLTGMRDDAAVMRLLVLETLRGSPMLSRVRASAPTRTLDAVSSLLAEHRAAGRLRADVDPRILAQAFGGMLFAFGFAAPILRDEPFPEPAETAKAITDIFLAGTLGRPR